MRILTQSVLSFLILTSLGLTPVAAKSPPPAHKPPEFTVVPKVLVPDVNFWIDIFTKYDNNTAILHDTEYLGVTYGTVSLKDIPCMDDCSDAVKKARIDRLRAAKERVRGILLTLADDPPASTLSDEAKNIKAEWRKHTSANIFAEAAGEKRLRTQVGQRDRFLAGLSQAEHYMPKFETIFKADNMPIELTRLVMVESMFNMKAISSAGASGVWQFMPETARRYGLRITPAIDERNDPILASYAAARLLRADYTRLGTWPLAINAYNAGCGRLGNACTIMGTRDITKIIRGFRQGAYGFASRNYYPEFLAACQVYDRRIEFFPTMKHLPPLKYKTISISKPTPLAAIAKQERTSVSKLEELNLSFRDAVINGRIPVPAGVEVRIPTS